MTVEYIDGIKTLRLHDGAARGGHVDLDLAMLRIWQSLSGGHAMRDASVFCRRI